MNTETGTVEIDYSDKRYAATYGVSNNIVQIRSHEFGFASRSAGLFPPASIARILLLELARTAHGEQRGPLN